MQVIQFPLTQGGENADLTLSVSPFLSNLHSDPVVLNLVC